MSDWIYDPFGSYELDPEFGLFPGPNVKEFLASYLGLSKNLTWPLSELRDKGLKRRVKLAQRELSTLHIQEQQRLLTEAARMVSHKNMNADQRQRARAIWSGPLLTPLDWREQCREELMCGGSGRAGRAGSGRTPTLLHRMCRRDPEEWPSAGDLMRAALNLKDTVNLRLEFVCAAFVEGLEDGLSANLEQLWEGDQLGPTHRLSLLRSLAVLHEAAGESEKAQACWGLLLGRDEGSLLAHLSCFSLAISAGDEEKARKIARALGRQLDQSRDGEHRLRRAFRERAWIGRASRVPLTAACRAVRLSLLTMGDPLLCELCLELA